MPTTLGKGSPPWQRRPHFRAATRHGGQETTLFTIITDLLHFGVRVIGLNYGSADRMKVDEITGGAPYAATTIAGTNAQGQPSQNALAARYEGRAIAETAAKLHRDAIRTRQGVGHVDVAIRRNGC